MMKNRAIRWFAILIYPLILVACGAAMEEDKLTLSGSVSFGDTDSASLGPVFVAVLNQSPMEGAGSSMADALVAIKTIRKQDPRFSMTLTSRVARPGDQVYIAAFADNDFSNGIPNPGPGDMIGYYVDPERMSPAYSLKQGDNSGLDIALTKEIFDFEAAVSGRILGDTPGKVTVVALAGEITSIDVTQIDPYDIVGLTQFAKGQGPEAFSLDIFPYGFNVPIEDVFLIAMLDANANDLMDQGDRVGFYTHGEPLPQLLTINPGLAGDYDITPDLPIPGPSGDTVRIGGTVVVPESLEPVIGDIPLFILVVESDEDLDLKALASGDMKSISNFRKLPAGGRDFDLDLSKTGLAAGDRIVVIAVCDLAYTAGFPDVGVGDYTGYYVDAIHLGPEITLVQGGNEAVSLTLNKEVFDYEASLSGHIPAGYEGEATVFPYFGDISKMDFSEMDTDAVPGFTRLMLDGDAVDFTVPIFPFGRDLPIENCFLIIFVDADGGGTVSQGDLLGFYTGGSAMPQLITINEGNQAGFTLEPTLTIPDPSSGKGLALSGHISVPEELSGTIAGKPLFVIVVRADGNVDLNALAQGDLSSIAYFERFPAGTTEYTLDVSGTGLAEGEKVMVIALCDMGFEAGLPLLSAGDYVGFYLDEDAMGPELTLEAGDNRNVSITLSREVYDYEATLSGVVYSDNDPETHKGRDGNLTLFAYAGDITSFDFNIDLDKVIGFQRIDKQKPYVSFQLDILPYGYQLPVENVYVFAWLDTDRNGGMPDAGDLIGFVAGDNNLPVLLTVDGTDPGDLLITLSMPVPEPDPLNSNVVLTGPVAVPPGINVEGLTICILVVEAGESLDMSSLVEGDLSGLAWYEKLEPGTRDFNCNLSKRGLSAGDRVMVLAVCDRQLTGPGFPDLSPGDYLGFYQNNGEMDITLTLASGENSLKNEGEESFALSRIMYEHNATVLFELEDDRLQNLNPPVALDPGETVTVAVLAEDGVAIDLSGNASIQMDYLLGYERLTVPESGNAGHYYTLGLLPYIDRRITVYDPFAIERVYVFAIFDGNTNGAPGQNNYLGYYWNVVMLYPAIVDWIIDGPNVLDETVRFRPD